MKLYIYTPIIVSVFILLGCSEPLSEKELFIQASQSFHSGDCKNALKLTEQLLKNKYTSGNVMLGIMYESGQCKEKDILKAEQLYLQDVHQGYASSKYAVSALYLSDGYFQQTGKYNTVVAKKFLQELAHEEQDGDAMLLLANLYEESKYGQKDLKKSKEWLKKSAEHGNQEAKQILSQSQ